MLAQLLAALAALDPLVKVLVPLLLVVLPFAIKALVENIKEADRVKLLAATKAAVLIVGAFAKGTPTKLDDSLVEVLRVVESELGKPLKKSQAVKVRNMALSLHSDERFPAQLGDGDALSIARKR